MKTFLLFLVAIFFLTIASAQIDTNFYNLSLRQLAQIKISTPGRNVMTALTAPSNIITITEDEIRKNNYTCLRDLLDDIPQIIIQHRSSDENEDIYTINGIWGNEKFLILMDGVRINSAAGTDITIGQSYSLANVKQVEIILNPSSVLYGADAFTAIVNIITYRPEEKKGMEVNAQRGIYNTYNASLAANYKTKKLGMSLVGKYYESEGPFMPIYYPDLFKWYYVYERTGKVIRFGDTIQAPIGIKPWDIYTRSANIRAKLFYKKWELGYMNFFESHSTSITGRPEYSIYCRQAHYYTTLYNIYLKHSHTSRDGKFESNSLFNFQTFKILPNSAFVNRYTNFNVAYKYENARDLHWEQNFRYSGLKNHLFNLGFSADFYDVIPKTGDLPVPYDESKPYNQQNIYYFGTNITDYAGNDLTIYQDFYRIRYYNLSIYAQSTYHFANNLYVILGLRGEYNSRYRGALLPRLSFVYTPTNYFSVKLIYGKAFIAPSVHTEYQHFGSFIPVKDSLGRITGLTSPFWRLVTPNLKPQYKDSYEITLTSFINDNIYFKINAFYTNLYNLINHKFVYDTSFHNVHVDKAWILENTGYGQAYGGTFSATSTFKVSYLNVKTTFSYTYIDGQIQKLPLQFSPKHSIKAKITLNYLDDINLTIGAQYRSISFYYPSADNPPVTSPAYYIVYASGNTLLIEHKWSRLWLTYRAINLLNKHYYNLSDGSIGASPQPPIELMVGIRASF